MRVHHTSNPWTYLEVKRSKVKVTRQINAHTVNVQYIPNGKAYELQTCYLCLLTFVSTELMECMCVHSVRRTTKLLMIMMMMMMTMHVTVIGTRCSLTCLTCPLTSSRVSTRRSWRSACSEACRSSPLNRWTQTTSRSRRTKMTTTIRTTRQPRTSSNCSYTDHAPV